MISRRNPVCCRMYRNWFAAFGLACKLSEILVRSRLWSVSISSGHIVFVSITSFSRYSSNTSSSPLSFSASLLALLLAPSRVHFLEGLKSSGQRVKLDLDPWHCECQRQGLKRAWKVNTGCTLRQLRFRHWVCVLFGHQDYLRGFSCR